MGVEPVEIFLFLSFVTGAMGRPGTGGRRLVYFKALRPCRRSVSILDPMTELKSMAMVSEKRSEEKRSEEKKRKEKTRYWLHAHGAGNFTQLL